MHSDSQNLSQKELLRWVNTILQINLMKIQDLSSGVHFCHLLQYVHRGQVPLHKLNIKAKLEYESLVNLKILSTAMLKLGIDHTFDMTKISQKKVQDILYLLKWFQKYVSSKNLNQNQVLENRRVSANLGGKILEAHKVANFNSLNRKDKKRQTSMQIPCRSIADSEMQLLEIQKIAENKEKNTEEKLMIISSILTQKRCIGTPHRSESSRNYLQSSIQLQSNQNSTSMIPRKQLSIDKSQPQNEFQNVKSTNKKQVSLYPDLSIKIQDDQLQISNEKTEVIIKQMSKRKERSVEKQNILSEQK